MITSSTFSVGTQATEVTYPEPIDSIKGQSLAIYNNSSSVTVYVGGSDVTTANGFPIKPETQLSVELSTKQSLYAITDSSASVSVLWVDVK